MVISGETHTVELTYAGQNISVTETSTSFYNERQKVQVSLAKVIERDKTFGIGDNGEIKNISFGLYAAEDIVSASGTVIPADGLIEIVSVNENGTAVMKSDLPFGKYYVKEIATDEHYILSDTKYPVVFEYAGQDTATVEIKVNDGKEIKNELIYGSVFLSFTTAPAKRLCQILRTGRHSWLRLAEIISYVMTNSYLYMHSDLMQQRFLR